MLGRARIVLCALAGVLLSVGGCSTPNYNTTTAQLCSDNKLSGDETDIDCGGSCNPCAVTKTCSKDADCAMATCIGNKCYDSSCRDNILNNTETDIDCGGAACPACKDGRACGQSSDCINGNPCIKGICFDSGCNNQKKDGHETGTDCGGDQCPACDALQGCKQTADCKTGNTCIDNTTLTPCDDATSSCQTNTGTCYPDTCRNGNLDVRETDIDCGGGLCLPCAVSKHCAQNSDCAAGNVCIAGTCYVNTCADTKIDGSETDQDCGGSACPACTKGLNCNVASDCQANTPCTGGKCGDPACFNKQLDPGETGLDCGGVVCPPCDIAQPCKIKEDCKSLNCDTGNCAQPSCTDSAQNGAETGLNCGDPAGQCKRCGTGIGCTGDTSCDSNHCDTINKVCLAASCTDGRLNGDETGLDCGGTCALVSPYLRCDDLGPCRSDQDCKSFVCLVDATTKRGVCQVPTCSDTATNGDETDLNCGGSCATSSATGLCQLSQRCKTDHDCATGLNCLDFACQTPLCKDGIQDGGETWIDCGGTCNGCPDGKPCDADTPTHSDCASLVCGSDGTCAQPSCNDNVQNGAETGLNCGGGSCGKCPDGLGCKLADDCSSGVCNQNKCAAPTCLDGVKNGTELSIDCAGSCPIGPSATNPTCGQDSPCAKDADCSAPNICSIHGQCSPATCSDYRVDQTETDIDCGGICADATSPKRCDDNLKCLVNEDCKSSLCNRCNINDVCTGSTGTCTPASCPDGKLNGTETDQDCGGPNCSIKCPDNSNCAQGSDCVSKVCTGNICQPPTCTDGQINGTETDQSPSGVGCGGGKCDKCADSYHCLYDTDCLDGSCLGKDCSSGSCIPGTCLVPGCGNGQLDTGETAIDCGGPTCNPCDSNTHCLLDRDCISKICDTSTGTGVCAVPSCRDRAINGNETDLNCGGGGANPCPSCADGSLCKVDSDCTDQVCDATLHCAKPTCTDNYRNGDEIGKNCRGSDCPTTLCPDGQPCVANSDCTNNWCKPGTNICTTPTCSDGTQNQDETYPDCGGQICSTRCALNQACKINSDCASTLWCKNLSCTNATATCADGFQNSTETGVDCGGNCTQSCYPYTSSCQQCADTKGCSSNDDCKSLNCVNNVCAAPSGTTPAACVGKLLDGGATSCKQCDTASNPTGCKTYLMCMYKNSCDPGTDAAKSHCVDATYMGGGVCSFNKVQIPTDVLTSAINAYRCACP